MPIVPPSFPEKVYLTELTHNAAPEIYRLLLLGYQNDQSTVAPFPEWWSNLRADLEFNPSLCFLAYDEKGIIAVAQCWTSAFIKDMVVHPRWRRQGIAESLLLHVFAVFRERKARAVDLKVKQTNTPAISLYLKLDMQIIEKLP